MNASMEMKKAGTKPAFSGTFNTYFLTGAAGTAGAGADAVLAPPSKKALTQVVWLRIA